MPASAKQAKVRDWLRSRVDLVAVLRRLSYDDGALLDLMSPTRQVVNSVNECGRFCKGAKDEIPTTSFDLVTSGL